MCLFLSGVKENALKEFGWCVLTRRVCVCAWERRQIQMASECDAKTENTRINAEEETSVKVVREKNWKDQKLLRGSCPMMMIHSLISLRN